MAQFSVRTRYSGPTDTRGSMISVKNLHNDRTERYGYDHSVSDPHLASVQASYPNATMIVVTASNATGDVYRVTVPDTDREALDNAREEAMNALDWWETYKAAQKIEKDGQLVVALRAMLEATE